MSSGTITVERPRVSDMEERFASRLLPLFKRRTEAVGALLPELYLYGLSLGDFDLALRGSLGDAAPISPSSILRLKQDWQEQHNTWKRRDLSDLDIVVSLGRRDLVVRHRWALTRKMFVGCVRKIGRGARDRAVTALPELARTAGDHFTGQHPPNGGDITELSTD